MKSALHPAPLRSLAGRYLAGLGAVCTPELAGADGVRPRDQRSYAPGGVFDPLFAGLLADAGIRAATLGRLGSPYARLSNPAAPTAW